MHQNLSTLQHKLSVGCGKSVYNCFDLADIYGDFSIPNIRYNCVSSLESVVSAIIDQRRLILRLESPNVILTACCTKQSSLVLRVQIPDEPTLFHVYGGAFRLIDIRLSKWEKIVSFEV